MYIFRVPKFHCVRFRLLYHSSELDAFGFSGWSIGVARTFDLGGGQTTNHMQ